MQGDIVALYNDSETKLASYTYDTWGNASVNCESGIASVYNPYGYCGYYYDSDLELYCLGTRYYDSVTGRFLSPDSYVSTGQGLLGYNMYAYCNNSPVNYVDPTGESAEALLLSWLSGAGPIAAAEPTIFGEAVLVAGLIVVGGIWLGETVADSIESFDELYDIPKSISQDSQNLSSNNEIKVAKDYDPNPYRREGEKKQNRENRNKSRYNDDWESRNNRRDGKPSKPKSHTPSKKGHKKYFSLSASVSLF